MSVYDRMTNQNQCFLYRHLFFYWIMVLCSILPMRCDRDNRFGEECPKFFSLLTKSYSQEHGTSKMLRNCLLFLNRLFLVVVRWIHAMLACRNQRENAYRPFYSTIMFINLSFESTATIAFSQNQQSDVHSIGQIIPNSIRWW